MISRVLTQLVSTSFSVVLYRKKCWITQNVIVSTFWLTVLCSLAMNRRDHRLIMFFETVLLVHAIEIPVALHTLKRRGVPRIRICLLTLVYGFTWWLPVKLGVYAGA